MLPGCRFLIHGDIRLLSTAGSHVRSLLHRHLWQKLPRQHRRAALFRAASLSAPRIAPKARACEPIIVVGTFRSASGLGESARLCRDALLAAGLGVHSIDITASMMQSEDLLDEHSSQTDLNRLSGPGTLIVHVNAPLMGLALTRVGAKVVREKHVIGYWAWELPRTPPEWRYGIPFVHRIWVPSSFTAGALASVAGSRPLHVVPHPVGTLASRQRTKSEAVHCPERPFTVLKVFNAASSFERKNPLAAISAFRRAFRNDPGARLIVKASNLSASPAGRMQIERLITSAKNITLLTELMAPHQIRELYARSDVLLSLHRSEGFGLTLAEAMLRGLPVIATDWSGSADFVNPETGIPIPYHLTPARDPQGTYDHPEMHWAEADVGAAAAALVRLRNDPELRRQLGRAAAACAAERWSAEAYGAHMRGILQPPVAI